MFGSVVLEVALGLATLYFLVATLCLAIQELMASILATRAKVLYGAVLNMLGRSTINLCEAFYQHPTIRAIGNPRHYEDREPSKFVRRLQGDGAGNPHYIPAGTFCDVLIDLLLRSGTTAPGDDKPLTQTDSKLLPIVPPTADRKQGGLPLLTALHAAVAKLPESDPKKALVMALNEARGDADRARANIEAWFNGTMDRASGWYKRRTQFWLLAYATLVALLLNADTIAIGRALATDKDLRQTVAQAAAGYAHAPPAPGATTPPTLEQAAADLQRLTALTSRSSLPLGWISNVPPPEESKDPVLTAARSTDARLVPSTAAGWTAKAAGLLLTILAVSLGAPFWFDMLNKIVNVRAAGKPPDPARAEPLPTPAPPPFAYQQPLSTDTTPGRIAAPAAKPGDGNGTAGNGQT